MSQNVLESFRREQQEGLMVRKGARPPGEREGEEAAFLGMGPRKNILEGVGSSAAGNLCPEGGPVLAGRGEGCAKWRGIRRTWLLEGQGRKDSERDAQRLLVAHKTATTTANCPEFQTLSLQ